MKINGYDQFYLYNLTGNKADLMKTRISFKKDIRVDLLKPAIQSAIKDYPTYGWQYFINKDGLLEAKQNDRELPIFANDDEVKLLGTKDTNYYLFSVRYDKNSIYTTIGHTLTDGRGAIFFLRAVAYYYLKLQGIELDANIMLPSQNSNLKGMYELAENIPSKPLNWPPKPNDMFVPKEDNQLLKTNKTKIMQIEFDINQVKQLADQYQTSVFTLLFILIAQAEIEYYQAFDKTILANIPVDMRKRLNNPEGLTNYGLTINVEYARGLYNKPIQEQINSVRQSFKQLGSIDNLISWTKIISDFSKKTDVIPLSDDGQKKVDSMIKSIINDVSFLFSAMGEISLPKQAQEYITHFDLLGQTSKGMPVFHYLYFFDKGILDCSQQNTNEGLFNCLLNKFNKLGLKAKPIDLGLVTFDKLYLDKLESEYHK